MDRRRNKFGRRLFLKALGAGIGAPLAMRMSRLAVAAPTKAPVRLFIYYVPHGWPAEHLDSLILPALADHKKQMSVVRGLSMNDGMQNHPSIQGTLTGFGSGMSQGAAVDSIDYLIAQKLGVDAHVLGAIPRFNPAAQDDDSKLVQHGGAWAFALANPVEAATKMLAQTKTPDGSGEADPAADDRAFRKLALGVTERELETMHSTLKGMTSVQSKLSVHLESVRQLRAQQDKTLVNLCTGDREMPKLAAMAGRDHFDEKNFGYVVDAHLEVAAEAMLCGSAQVVTMQNMYTNANLLFNFEGGPGIAKQHHAVLSHARGDAPLRKEFAQCQKWFLNRLNDVLLTKLNQPDPFDTSSTVLDNSIIYVCSEVSDGAEHNSDASEVWIGGKPLATSLPALLIGGGGGFLNKQSAVNVDRKHTDMLATLAKGMGVDLKTMGGEAVNAIEEVTS